MVALDIHTGPIPPSLLSQLFWTSVSLLESDYEQEFTMALRLLNKVGPSSIHVIAVQLDLCQHGKKHNRLECYASIMLA